MLASYKNGTIYIGVTNNLLRRIFEHKNNMLEGFTRKYQLHKLVYYEVFPEIQNAIVRERQLKRWRRHWKITLIEEVNPDWNDLYDDIKK